MVDDSIQFQMVLVIRGSQVAGCAHQCAKRSSTGFVCRPNHSLTGPLGASPHPRASLHPGIDVFGFPTADCPECFGHGFCFLLLEAYLSTPLCLSFPVDALGMLVNLWSWIWLYIYTIVRYLNIPILYHKITSSWCHCMSLMFVLGQL